MNYKDTKDKFLNAIKDLCTPHTRLQNYIEIGNVEQIKKLFKRKNRMSVRSKADRTEGDQRRIINSFKSPIYHALYSSNIEVLKTVLECSANSSVILYPFICVSAADKKECSVLEFNPIDYWLEKHIDDIFDGFKTSNFLPKYKVLREYFPISTSARVQIDQFIAFTDVREWEEDQPIRQQKNRILEEIEGTYLQKVRRI